MLNQLTIGIIISILFIFLVIIFCVLIIKIYIQKIKKYNAVIYQNEIDFQKNLNESIVETQEQLLQSISQELHDDAGQQLTVINFQLENLKLDFPDLALTTNPLSESISNLSNSLRNISHLLSNSFVSKNDLYVTIKAELDRLNKQSKIDISYKIVANSKKQFSDTEKIMLFRIFQETINNSLKHAKAKKISVEIFENPIFKLQITDDGKGFDTYKSESKKSIGISNMKTRAKLIRFDFDIFSLTNQGTTTTITELK